LSCSTSTSSTVLIFNEEDVKAGRYEYTVWKVAPPKSYDGLSLDDVVVC
jgi:hypothetical protein